MHKTLFYGTKGLCVLSLFIAFSAIELLRIHVILSYFFITNFVKESTSGLIPPTANFEKCHVSRI